jgi:hypothetical protein
VPEWKSSPSRDPDTDRKKKKALDPDSGWIPTRV